MFTGLIETIGTISDIRKSGNYRHLSIKPEEPFENAVMGESIAVDGCCLTVTRFDKTSITLEASQETLASTIVGQYREYDTVNLERALLPTSRLGGHLVTGHVDTIGKIARLKRTGNSLEATVQYPREYETFLVARGSITINGISLTITDLRANAFGVNLIPHTQAVTSIDNWKKDNKVNLEFDIIGKYIVRLHNTGSNTGLTLKKMFESGW